MYVGQVEVLVTWVHSRCHVGAGQPFHWATPMCVAQNHQYLPYFCLLGVVGGAKKSHKFSKYVLIASDWAKVPNSKVVAFFKAATVVPRAPWGPQGQAVWGNELGRGLWGMFVVVMYVM